MTQFEFLKKSFETGVFSHAYLFSGNDAKGKEEAVSHILELFGGNNVYTHPDVVIVKLLEEEGEKAKEITIGQIRALTQRVSLGAWTLPFTFVVFQEAHRINQEAQSALLKLMEEPKGKTVFFMLSDYPFLILATLRSRMQEVKFWKFDSLDKEFAHQKQGIEEFEKFQKQTLREKFVVAKELSESQQKVQDCLQSWSICARLLMLLELKQNSPKVVWYANILKLLQETRTLIETTNASTRLLLERIILEL